ncbi:hypothetical protein N480_25450 [Pseudoalteromonas luteoviolacea S2607]|uniref:hypothetical protein n=1 Tax=Pseudoalteromonas luteoviolacea TaxID=43657 RepID=UPI0007B1679E|nr:hypothetical protein [Pseudoalteromonas luteoviolacea]KZN32598.1 hypothetical protein N480_25450 [Pseudoalteromonas luteoviolacea S2607]
MKYEQVNDIENLQLILWAFEKGYGLGRADVTDGIYIERDKVLNHFKTELQGIIVESS